MGDLRGGHPAFVPAAEQRISRQVVMLERPRPPESLIDDWSRPFMPAPEAERWMRSVFIDSDGPLANPDHEHLQQARIGVLWAALPQSRHMRSVVGQAEIPQFQGNAWCRGRQEQQMVEWFGELPDFVITFDAHFVLVCNDREWCRLVEHELYHCAQQLNSFGAPKFRKDGTPSFGIRGHDIEEFVGVVKRYGATEAMQAMFTESQKPHVGQASIDGVCGTCKLIV